jgi:hypothetical protein
MSSISSRDSCGGGFFSGRGHADNDASRQVGDDLDRHTGCANSLK